MNWSRSGHTGPASPASILPSPESLWLLILKKTNIWFFWGEGEVACLFVFWRSSQGETVYLGRRDSKYSPVWNGPVEHIKVSDLETRRDQETLSLDLHFHLQYGKWLQTIRACDSPYAPPFVCKCSARPALHDPLLPVSPAPSTLSPPAWSHWAPRPFPGWTAALHWPNLGICFLLSFDIVSLLKPPN